MSASHLLSLSALHAAAPGVLDIVFGADGDFEGAPGWCPPLWVGTWDGEHCRWGWRWDVVCDDGHLIVPDEDDLIEDAAFDCRVPSVAARLAGLCARAVGETGEGWRVCRIGPMWILTDGLMSLQWDRYGGPRCALGPHLGENFDASNVYAFLASLTLALAPRIAALGVPR